MIARVLVVEDDASVRDALAQTLELADLDPITAGSFVAAKDHITPDFDGVILSDIRMPGRDGFHLLTFSRDMDPELPVVLLTGEGDIPMAVAAIEQGAFDFLEKPCAPGDLTAVLQRALKTRALVLENRKLKSRLEKGDAAERMIFGASPKSEELRARVRAVAATDVDVLISGDPGSGVSKVAEAIHLVSGRASGPFLKRSCNGLGMPDLQALLTEAEGGSLFLDDISALPSDAQLMLLDHLEAGSGTRILAASIRDLDAEMQDGQLNDELYFRLGIMPIRIPALSERPSDIPILFRKYVALSAEQSGLPAPEITQEVIAGLMARDWPGNARALMSEAMRFVMGVSSPEANPAELGLAEQMAQVERTLLIAALQKTGGKASVAAQALKLPRKTFYDKLARYDLKAEDYRG